MTTQPIVLRQFNGIRPRVPAGLLGPNDATTAEQCDLGYGDLRNTHNGVQVAQLAIASESIYTDDGIEFFSWPGDVNAARSPIAQDLYNRLYYTNGTAFSVTSRDQMETWGGQPMTSFLVGVPRPTVAPSLSAVPSPQPANENWTASFFYESAGTKYQAANVALTAGTVAQTWTFPVPAIASDTPGSAVPQVELIGMNSSTGVQEFDAYSSTSSFTGSTPNAADWTLTLTISGTTGTLTLAASSQQGANQETLAYVYTYVNDYEEEGPPSDATLVTHEIGLEVDVTVTLDESILAAGYNPIGEIRVYRTPSGSSTANYFYAGSIYPTYSLTSDPTTFVLKDTVLSADLGEELASNNYYPPPPGLVGLGSLPNGILYGWLDNALYFCNAYMPWAWNPANVLTFPNAIVGALPIGGGLVISTTASPFVVSGLTPDAMSAAALNISQSGISKWSFANVGGQAMYASQEGIVVIQGVFGSLEYSDRFFTRDVWKQRYSAGFAHMRFAAWDGRLVVWSDNDSFTPFMIRFEEAGGQMTDLPGFSAQGSFVSPITDGFYYLIGDTVYDFNEGDPQTAIWTSREMVLPHPTNFGAAEVICTGQWVFTLYADNDDGVFVQRFQTELNAGGTRFRLPGGYKSRRWQVSLIGSGELTELRIAESMRELGDI